MEALLILSQAVTVLRVLYLRVDHRLTLLEDLEDCEEFEKVKRSEIQQKLLSTKEQISYCLKCTEDIVSYLREEI